MKPFPPVKTALIFLVLFLLPAFDAQGETRTFASNNIPLDSPVYYYLDKLASYGMINSDFKGIRPITGAEAARLLAEAEKAREEESAKGNGETDEELYDDSGDIGWAGGSTAERKLIREMIHELRHYLAREIAMVEEPESVPVFDVNPLSTFRARYVYVDGVPRSYERPVFDPGGDGVFGIGSGLRARQVYPAGIVQQHGSEGTPLLDYNEGVVYRRGHNVDLRFSGDAYAGRYLSAFIEPMFLY